MPTDGNGHVADTEKTLQKIFQRSTEGKWEEVTGALGSEIFDYFMKAWEEIVSGNVYQNIGPHIVCKPLCQLTLIKCDIQV